MKALELLKTNPTIEERAGKFVTSIKRDLQKKYLDSLIERKESLEDNLFELTNFTLQTDVNQGLIQMTKDQCQSRFERILNIEYELELLSRELEIKQNLFNKYFS